MAGSKGSGNPQRDLNHMQPATAVVKLGDRIFELQTTVNRLVARQNTLLAALVAANGAVLPSLAAVTALTAATAVNTLVSPGPPLIPGDRP